jgi:hypothetical protein
MEDRALQAHAKTVAQKMAKQPLYFKISLISNLLPLAKQLDVPKKRGYRLL